MGLTARGCTRGSGGSAPNRFWAISRNGFPRLGQKLSVVTEIINDVSHHKQHLADLTS